jgi:glutamate synthase (NADPH/NADH) large chain
MSGGVAYVLDLREDRVNRDLVDLMPLRDRDVDVVHELLTQHRQWTDSAVAGRLLAGWDNDKSRFTLVLPRDYQRVLDVRATAESEGLDLNGPQVWERIMEASRG